MVDIRKAHEVAPRVYARESDEVKTQQSQREEADVNAIVKRHFDTGTPLPGSVRQPHYGDASVAVDLQTAIEMVRSANEQFDQLPVGVRDAVKHDPVLFMEALADEEATAALVARGLVLTEDSPSVDAEPEAAAQPPEATNEDPNGSAGPVQT